MKWAIYSAWLGRYKQAPRNAERARHALAVAASRSFSACRGSCRVLLMRTVRPQCANGSAVRLGGARRYFQCVVRGCQAVFGAE
jgi:hypothetical protein